MIEITLKTDAEVGANTILVGIEPRTGFNLYRRFNRYELNTDQKEHTVNYEEWLVAKDGKVYDIFYRRRQFKAVNITDVVPNKLRYDQWFNQFKTQFGVNINNFITAIPLTSNETDVLP
jgi:hypothetical protein